MGTVVTGSGSSCRSFWSALRSSILNGISESNFCCTSASSSASWSIFAWSWSESCMAGVEVSIGSGCMKSSFSVFGSRCDGSAAATSMIVPSFESSSLGEHSPSFKSSSPSPSPPPSLPPSQSIRTVYGWEGYLWIEFGCPTLLGISFKVGTTTTKPSEIIFILFWILFRVFFRKIIFKRIS